MSAEVKEKRERERENDKGQPFPWLSLFMEAVLCHVSLETTRAIFFFLPLARWNEFLP
jgi:hypothetical protein